MGAVEFGISAQLMEWWPCGKRKGCVILKGWVILDVCISLFLVMHRKGVVHVFYIYSAAIAD